MLHIIANQFFLSSFLLESVSQRNDVSVILHPRRRRGAHRSLLKLLEAYLGWRPGASLFFAKDYIDQLSAIGKEDHVLVFGIENIKELRIVKRFIKSPHISLFTWNPVLDYNQSAWVRRSHIRTLKGLGARIYTFDPDDASNYGLTLTNQVYRDVSEYLDGDMTPDLDIYFVGQDKGRWDELKHWMAVAHKAGLATCFHVVKDKQGHYSPQDLTQLSSGGLSYQDNIQMIRRSRCLLEIVQKNQSGLTVRSLEAAFFGKKLISNNLRMKHSVLYDPGRVFLIGHDDPNRLREFVESPFVAVAPDVLKNFDFSHWCRQFA